MSVFLFMHFCRTTVSVNSLRVLLFAPMLGGGGAMRGGGGGGSTSVLV